MKKILMTAALCAALPFLFSAKAIASALRLKDRHEMPTVKEWFDLDRYN